MKKYILDTNAMIQLEQLSKLKSFAGKLIELTNFWKSEVESELPISLLAEYRTNVFINFSSGTSPISFEIKDGKVDITLSLGRTNDKGCKEIKIYNEEEKSLLKIISKVDVEAIRYCVEKGNVLVSDDKSVKHLCSLLAVDHIHFNDFIINFNKYYESTTTTATSPN